MDEALKKFSKYDVLITVERVYGISFSFKLLDWMIIGLPKDLSRSHWRSNSRYWLSMVFQTQLEYALKTSSSNTFYVKHAHFGSQYSIEGTTGGLETLSKMHVLRNTVYDWKGSMLCRSPILCTNCHQHSSTYEDMRIGD